MLINWMNLEYFDAHLQEIIEIMMLRKEKSRKWSECNILNANGIKKDFGITGLEKRIERLEKIVFSSAMSRWRVKKFMDGFRAGKSWLDESWEEVTVLPSSRDISERSLFLAFQGVKYVLDRCGLDFQISMGSYDSEIGRIFEESKGECEGAICLKKPYIGGREYGHYKHIVIVDGSEFFAGAKKRVAGMASSASSEKAVVVLERALAKGRFLERYVGMDFQEREEYFKNVVSHEFRHMVAEIPEEEISMLTVKDYVGPDLYPPDYGYMGEPNCVGISSFMAPVKLCDMCRDGIMSFWHGARLGRSSAMADIQI
jgi:hypothetical protein